MVCNLKPVKTIYYLILVVIISVASFLCLPSNASALVDNPKENINKSLVLSIGGQKASVNGTIVDMEKASIPIIVASRTLVPLRFISERLGASVVWDPSSSTAEIKKDNNRIMMQVGIRTYNKNGTDYSLDVPPIIKEARVFVPLRALAEALGLKVQFYDPLIVIAANPSAELSLREKRWLVKNLSINDATNKMADIIISEIIKPGMTDLEKAYAIFHFIKTDTFYDDNYATDGLIEIYEAYGALVDGKSVCGGNAKAVQVLMGKAGIESHYIVGQLYGASHAWNIIKLGGQYYHLDATTNQFLTSDSYMDKFYDWSPNSGWSCNINSPESQGFEFYVKGDYIYYSNFGENVIDDLNSNSSNLYRAKLDGSGKELLFKSNGSLIWIWTCDGKYVYYGERSNGTIYKTNLNTKETVSYNIPIIDESGGLEDMLAEDGWIYIYTAYDELNKPSRSYLFRMKPDGTGCEKIMDDPTADKCLEGLWPRFGAIY